MLQYMNFYHMGEIDITNTENNYLTLPQKQDQMLKTASKKLVRETAEATGEFIGNKIADKIIKPKPESYVNSRNVEEIIILFEKREEILNE